VPGSGAASGTAAGGLIGPPRAGAPRTPKVSGSPPWGPAPEPPGEVPWGRPLIPPAAGPPVFPAGSPQPPVASRPEFLASAPPEPPDPKPSVWDAIAEEAWPGGPGASRPSDLPSRWQSHGSGVPGRVHDPSDRPDDEPSTGSQPIYVWNPGASTESFPAVPPDDDDER
jgi:hypothetical protein